MQNFDYQLEFQVRDYECDIQGIVNNAVYQNYLEHCRHQFLNSVGLDFVLLHNNGIDAVVIRAELNYKLPLHPGDYFIVRLKLTKKGNLRVIFNQEIVRKSDNKLMVDARITAVLTKNSKPVSSDFLLKKFEESGIVINED